MIKLTIFDIQDDTKNDDVFVNSRNITYFTRYNPHPWTLVHFIDGTKIGVKESCEQVLELIKGEKE